MTAKFNTAASTKTESSKTWLDVIHSRKEQYTKGPIAILTDELLASATLFYNLALVYIFWGIPRRELIEFVTHLLWIVPHGVLTCGKEKYNPTLKDLEIAVLGREVSSESDSDGEDFDNRWADEWRAAARARIGASKQAPHETSYPKLRALFFAVQLLDKALADWVAGIPGAPVPHFVPILERQFMQEAIARHFERD